MIRMSVTGYHQKYLNGYKKFREVCLSEGIPSEDVLMLWAASEIRDVRDAIHLIE